MWFSQCPATCSKLAEIIVGALIFIPRSIYFLFMSISYSEWASVSLPSLLQKPFLFCWQDTNQQLKNPEKNGSLHLCNFQPHLEQFSLAIILNTDVLTASTQLLTVFLQVSKGLSIKERDFSFKDYQIFFTKVKTVLNKFSREKMGIQKRKRASKIIELHWNKAGI